MRHSVSIVVTAIGAILILAGCETTPTQQGALIGGAIGAGTGAIIGNQSGHAGSGALIGAAAGGLGGALMGDMVEHSRPAAPQAAPPPQPQPVYVAPAPAPAPPPPPSGHYENRRVTTTTNETHEERVWVPDR